ncbi:MAG TPA: flippase activity-associated protein Agl23, partial [Nitrolancea sp.]|nr:flippase activity-associated protein Agl23 [Nitrolancea sp.]
MQRAISATAIEAGPIPRNLDTSKIRLPRKTLGERLTTDLTLEHFIYGVIFIIACLTRFWDLGSRALHHDESLHSYFSWVFAEGGGYIHDPLMHGPLLFHATALMYLLFGSSAAVSRIVPAALGVVVVMLPWLLRSERLFGRWGALASSALLLISPSILYYSRFIRHDIFLLAGTLLFFIAVVRYIEHPEARWAIIGALSIGYMLTTEEVSFIVLFVFATFIGIAVALKVAPSLLAVAGGAGVSFLVAAKVLHSLGAPALPGIPWDRPNGRQIEQFAIKLFEHPVVIAALGIAVLAILVAVWLLDRKRAPDVGWVEGLFGGVPEGSTAYALRELLNDHRALWIGTAGALTIFTVLYTSLFTNMTGLASGTFGALGYWLGQQGVQRGQEPWFYYLILLPQYEFIAVLIFPIAATLVVWRTLRAWRGGTSPDARTFVRGLLLYWSLGMIAVLSWAGEKMPWIVVHIALPMTLLAACFIGDAIEQIERRWSEWTPRVRREASIFGGAIVVLLATAFLALAWASDGPYVLNGSVYERTLRAGVVSHWWVYVYLPWLALL